MNVITPQSPHFSPITISMINTWWPSCTPPGPRRVSSGDSAGPDFSSLRFFTLAFSFLSHFRTNAAPHFITNSRFIGVSDKPQMSVQFGAIRAVAVFLKNLCRFFCFFCFYAFFWPERPDRESGPTTHSPLSIIASTTSLLFTPCLTNLLSI